MFFRHALSRRDSLFILLGASLMHISNYFFSPFVTTDNIVINNHVHSSELEIVDAPVDDVHRGHPVTVTATITETKMLTTITTASVVPTQPSHTQSSSILPETTIVHHAPGWTLFQNIYMSNGTFFLVSPEASRNQFPDSRFMVSNPLPAENTPENIALREPTHLHMSFISPEDASRRWGEAHSVVSVEGSTFFVNDPSQFLRHYYHLVAELFFGVQAFWHGAFSEAIVNPPPPSSLYPTSSAASPEEIHLNHPSIQSFDRVIFGRTDADGWRDDPGFNSYFLRAAFPSLTVEHQEDWNDRVRATAPWSNDVDRTFHFPLFLIADRSAAHRGVACGTQTQRTAAEAWELMRSLGKLRGAKVGGWWEPVRSRVLRFANVKPAIETDFYAKQPIFSITNDNIRSSNLELLPLPEKIVITYISRQSARHRKLTTEAHNNLVASLEELIRRKNSGRGRRDLEWELIVMEAEKMTKDEQLLVAGKTTFLVGVHGNGLTHLVWMPPTRYSSVIEIFYPQGFAHDYQWTTKALGMVHYAVWNDEYYVSPKEPPVNYPPGFQENEIPVHGPTVVKIIEERVADK